MKLSSAGMGYQLQDEGEKRGLNSELWHACAGPLVSLPLVGSRVIYFSQGHSEQVTASTNKQIDAHIPNYPNLPPQLICQLHNVTMNADAETDEVYAQMTLQPLTPQEQKEPLLPTELVTASRQPTNYFCKMLTASDTSTHGGFSVPRRAAEKVFPPLDFTQQPPAQELIARDIHDNEWKFRHIFRGQPKRHLLTTGWSVFVSAKRLVTGDSVIFIWNEKNQLLLGIRRANRPQTVMPSSVLSSDSMHIGLLAAAAHAAATNSRFTIFFNPRACPSEFIIPLAKYVKAVYHICVSVGMRFRMLFETEESSVRRYMGTITGICDLDPVRWPKSHWRSVKVGWDESTAGERQPRVSLWEIEPLTTFPMYPSPFSLRLKRPWLSGLPSLHGGSVDDMGFNSPLMLLQGDGTDRIIQGFDFQGMTVSPWLQPRLDASLLGLQPNMYQAVTPAALPESRNMDPMKQVSPSCLQFQQPQSITNSSALLQAQMMQQSQPHSEMLLPDIQGNQSHACLLEQLRQQNSFHGQQLLHQVQQLQQQPQHQLHQVPNQQLAPPTVASALSQLASAFECQRTSSETLASLCQRPNFTEPNWSFMTATSVSPLKSIIGTFSQDETSHLLDLSRAAQMVSSGDWIPKRDEVQSLLPSGPQSVMFDVNQLRLQQQNVASHSISLPPFPGKVCDAGQESGSDPTQSHLLFGVNIDSPSFLMQNGMPGLRGVVGETELTSMAFTTSNYLNGSGNENPLNPSAISSSCLDESSSLQSPENVDQINAPTRTFVKVYKSGSFGRSLDITRFSSYHELRSELARMFGLEGQLEDPLRSGWQLVFVDRENDVLLLGDDPWQEFVNSVWCIKILSPQEVWQMGDEDLLRNEEQKINKHGRELLNSVPRQKLSGNSCDGYSSRQDSLRNVSTRITSTGSLKF